MVMHDNGASELLAPDDNPLKTRLKLGPSEVGTSPCTYWCVSLYIFLCRMLLSCTLSRPKMLIELVYHMRYISCLSNTISMIGVLSILLDSRVHQVPGA